MVDTKLGRRRTLMIGAVIMMAAFYVLGGMILGIQKDNGGKIASAGTAVGAKGYVAMVCIYIFAIGYEFSWGPIVWVVCSEIYPTRIRAMSLSLTTAFNWAMNATIAKVTPIMIAEITYGTYFFFGSMAVIMGTFTYFLLPETRGRSLEEMDAVSFFWL
jgi:SP family sugar:H+ symporter-like MFS transporter